MSLWPSWAFSPPGGSERVFRPGRFTPARPGGQGPPRRPAAPIRARPVAALRLRLPASGPAGARRHAGRGRGGIQPAAWPTRWCARRRANFPREISAFFSCRGCASRAARVPLASRLRAAHEPLRSPRSRVAGPLERRETGGGPRLALRARKRRAALARVARSVAVSVPLAPLRVAVRCRSLRSRVRFRAAPRARFALAPADALPEKPHPPRRRWRRLALPGVPVAPSVARRVAPPPVAAPLAVAFLAAPSGSLPASLPNGLPPPWRAPPRRPAMRPAALPPGVDPCRPRRARSAPVRPARPPPGGSGLRPAAPGSARRSAVALGGPPAVPAGGRGRAYIRPAGRPAGRPRAARFIGSRSRLLAPASVAADSHRRPPACTTAGAISRLRVAVAASRRGCLAPAGGGPRRGPAPAGNPPQLPGAAPGRRALRVRPPGLLPPAVPRLRGPAARRFASALPSLRSPPPAPPPGRRGGSPPSPASPPLRGVARAPSPPSRCPRSGVSQVSPCARPRSGGVRHRSRAGCARIPGRGAPRRERPPGPPGGGPRRGGSPPASAARRGGGVAAGRPLAARPSPRRPLQSLRRAPRSRAPRAGPPLRGGFASVFPDYVTAALPGQKCP